jgi:hypothetical protein
MSTNEDLQAKVDNIHFQSGGPSESNCLKSLMKTDGSRGTSGAIFWAGWVFSALVGLSGCSSNSPPAPVSTAPPATTTVPHAASAASSSPPSAAKEVPAKAGSDCGVLKIELPELLVEKKVEAPNPGIEGGQYLAGFYEELAQLLRSKAKDHVRIGVIGDSNLTRDFLTGEMRRNLQQKYGDAGHGFVSPIRPWAWYQHMDVRHGYDKGGWKIFAISTNHAPDKAYGVSGIAGESKGKGLKAWVETAKADSPIGKTASHFGIFYLKQPGGGTFRVEADGKLIKELDSTGSSLEPAYFQFQLPDAKHRVEVVASTDKPVRVLGMTLEREKPGIIVDSYGIGGAHYFGMTYDNDAVLQGMMKLRRNNLLMFWLGTNTHFGEKNPVSIKKLIDARRAAIPNLPILIVSPPDHVKNLADGHSDGVNIRYVARLQKIAVENKVAYWNMRESMGGNFAMGRFKTSGLSNDLYHLNRKGSDYIGRRLQRALWKDFMGYVEKHPQAGCAEPTTPPTKP